MKDLLEVGDVVTEVVLDVTDTACVAAALYHQPSAPPHLVERFLDFREVNLRIVLHKNTVGVGRMNLDYAILTERLELFADVASIVGSILKVVIYPNSVGTYLLQQAFVRLRVESRPNADDNAFLLSHPADNPKSFDQFVVLGTRSFPSVATTAQWQESHLASEFPHCVEAIGNEVTIVITLDKTLCEESAHSHRRHFDIEAVGIVAELSRLRTITELVVEEHTLAQRSHVHFDTIGAELTGKRKLTEFLPLEHHPVACRNVIALCYSRHR